MSCNSTLCNLTGSSKCIISRCLWLLSATKSIARIHVCVEVGQQWILLGCLAITLGSRMRLKFSANSHICLCSFSLSANFRSRCWIVEKINLVLLICHNLLATLFWSTMFMAFSINHTFFTLEKQATACWPRRLRLTTLSKQLAKGSTIILTPVVTLSCHHATQLRKIMALQLKYSTSIMKCLFSKVQEQVITDVFWLIVNGQPYKLNLI